MRRLGGPAEWPTVHGFHTRWPVPAPPARVFAVLTTMEGYPDWWPQVRQVQRLDDGSGLVRVRSALPYTLHLLLRRDVRDGPAGQLRVALDGDLRGWCAFDIVPDGEATMVHLTQRVQVQAAALRGLPRVARPFLLANHLWMLRCGGRGLRRHLAGQR